MICGDGCQAILIGVRILPGGRTRHLGRQRRRLLGEWTRGGLAGAVACGLTRSFPPGPGAVSNCRSPMHRLCDSVMATGIPNPGYRQKRVRRWTSHLAQNRATLRDCIRPNVESRFCGGDSADRFATAVNRPSLKAHDASRHFSEHCMKIWPHSFAGRSMRRATDRPKNIFTPVR